MRANVIKRIARNFILTPLLMLPPASEATASSTTQPNFVPPISTFSIHLQDAPREKVLDEFARAAHVSFDPSAAGFWSPGNWPTPTVSLDIQDEPFWRALSHLQEALDIGFMQAGDASHFVPTRERGDWGWTGRPEAEGGSLLLSVRQVGRESAVFFQDPSKSKDSISLMIQALVQPGADWSIDEDGFEITSLTTDQGSELQSATVPIHAQSYLASGRMQIQLSAPAPSTPKIGWVTLIANCHCLVAHDSHTIKIASAEKSPSDQDVAGVKVHIATEQSAQQVTVHLSCDIPRAADRKAFTRFGRRLWTLWQNQLRLFDSNGVEISSNSAGTSGGTNQVGMYKNFGQGTASAPFRLEWTVPASVQETSLPLTIEEIPVP